jgi:hypothetical protein
VAMSEPCQKIAITQQTCYLRFAEGKPDHSDELPYETARGEMLILTSPQWQNSRNRTRWTGQALPKFTVTLLPRTEP